MTGLTPGLFPHMWEGEMGEERDIRAGLARPSGSKMRVLGILNTWETLGD